MRKVRFTVDCYIHPKFKSADDFKEFLIKWLKKANLIKGIEIVEVKERN